MTSRGVTSHEVVPFVGRSMELRLLQTWATEAACGDPRLVVVSGEAGSGKTRLIEVLLAGLGPTPGLAGGATIVSAACYDELGVPGRPLAQMLDALIGGDHFESWFGASARLPGVDPPLISNDFVRTVISAVTVSPAAARLVVVAVDDVHWSDETTAAAVAELAAALSHRRHTAPLPLLLLVASRPLIHSAHGHKLMSSLRREPTFRSFTLHPLREEHVAHLITATTGTPPAPRLTADLLRLSGGNPLLVQAALRCALELQAVAEQQGTLLACVDVLPAELLTLEADLEQRLAKLTTATIETLANIALLGDGCPLADLRLVATRTSSGRPSLTDSDAHAFETALEELIELGILVERGDRYQFSHPQLRQLVVGRESAPRRRRRHSLVAERLASQGDGRDHLGTVRVLEVAHHLDLAGDAVLARLVVPVAQAGAVEAFRIGSWGQASRFAELALARADELDVAERSAVSFSFDELLALAGSAHFRNADSAPAGRRFRDAISGARASRDLRLWGECILWLARSQTMLGSESAPQTLDTSPVDEFLAAAGSELPELRALLHEMLAEIHFTRGDFEAGLDASRRGRTAGRDVLNADLQTALDFGEGLNWLGQLELDRAESCFRSSARLAKSGLEPWRRSWGPGRLAIVALIRNQSFNAERHATEAETAAEAVVSWGERALAVALRSAALARQARFTDADEAGTEAGLLYERSEFVFVPSILLPNLAWSCAMRGDIIGGQNALDRAERLGVPGVWRLRLVLDALSGAADGSKPRRDSVRTPRGRPTAFTLSAWIAAVEAADLLAQDSLLATASGWLTELVEVGVCAAPDWGTSVPRLRAIAVWKAGDGLEAAALLSSLVDELDAAGAPIEAARAQFDLARVYVELGDGAVRARDALAEAAARFERLGLLPFLKRARAFALANSEKLWPSGVAHLERSTWVLLHSDIVNSTSLNQRAGDGVHFELMRDHDRATRTCLARHGGVEYKHHGDGVAAWFSDADRAVSCALDMQATVARLTGKWIDLPMELRIGIVAGDVTIGDGDLHGLTVVRAVRVCAEADAGQVVVGQEVAAMLERGPTSHVWHRLGRRSLKHLAEPELLFGIKIPPITV